jgi:predicted anti-sigma-YlaC factor YlaD
MRHISDEEIFRLVDGECTAEEQTVFQTHMGECGACKALFTEISALDTQLQQIILERPSDNFTEALMEKWQAAPVFDQPFLYNRSYSRILAPIAFVFSLVLIFISGFSNLRWFKNQFSPTKPDTNVAYDLTSLQSLVQNDLLLTVFLVVNAMLLLLVVDKTVLQPYFRKRMNQI